MAARPHSKLGLARGTRKHVAQRGRHEIITAVTVNGADGHALLSSRRARQAKETSVQWPDDVRRVRALRASCKHCEHRLLLAAQRDLNRSQRLL